MPFDIEIQGELYELHIERDRMIQQGKGLMEHSTAKSIFDSHMLRNDIEQEQRVYFFSKNLKRESIASKPCDK